MYQDGEKTKEQVIETAVEKAPVITADTVYLIEEVNLSDGTIQEKEEEIPVKYIGVGESIDDLQKFDADTFVNALFMTEQKEEETC